MKILLLSQFFSTTRGGGEYVFSMMVKNLAENGHKVWVITNKINDEEYKIHDNVKLIFVKPDLQYKGGLPPSFQDNIKYIINSISQGLKIIKNEKIDIIHSNNFSPALAGSMLSFLTSKPHITSVWDIFSLCGDDYWDKWAKQIGVSKIHSFLGPHFEKLIFRLSHDAIHTISEASRNDLIKFGARKPIHVIPPTIEESKPTIYNFSPTQFVYVGRLVFYKNVEVAIKAIKIVKKSEPEVKLVIIGGGPHEKILRDLVLQLDLESNIQFSGYVTTDEKLKLLATSNALLFPSLCEGFGLVILEAFDKSKPVLVSNIRPMSDIVSHEENGFVLDPYNENQWADYLLRIIRNLQEATKMGQNGNQLLKTKYDQKSMYEKIMNMYSETLKMKR